MPELPLKFEVYCDDCNAGLCNLTRSVTTRIRGEPSIRVQACPTCIKVAEQAARRALLAEQEAE